MPVLPLLALAADGPALGIADAVLEAFRDRARARSADASRMLPSGNALALGEALAMVDAAGLLLRRALGDLTRSCATGAHLSPAARARYLLDGAYVVASCTRAVDRLFAVSGAAALFDDSPLPRAFRDLHAMSAHAALRFEAAAERFAHLELGLPAESPLPPI